MIVVRASVFFFEAGLNSLHKAIRRTATWYTAHMSKMASRSSRSAPTIVLLTDDVDNRKKAEAENIHAVSGT